MATGSHLPPKSTKKSRWSNSYVTSVTPNCGDERHTRAAAGIKVCETEEKQT